MRIGRTIPPAAAPLLFRDILAGFKGLFKGERELSRFRLELKDYFGVQHCFLLSSGKAALTIILEALHDLNPERDEVLIPAYTCFSVPSAIVRAGLKVRLCDIGEDTFDFDHDRLLESLTCETKAGKLLAVLPTHLFGFPADVDGIKELLTDPLVAIVEDAAQALGCFRGEKKLGTLGDVGFFSLGRGKAVSTVEGGVILTNSDRLASAIGNRMATIPDTRLSRVLGLILKAASMNALTRPSLFWLPKALPFLKLGETLYDARFEISKLSSFQAGLACGWQAKLRTFQNARSINAGVWMKFIPSCRSDGLDCLDPPRGGLVNSFSPVRFPLRIKNDGLKNRLLKESGEKGLGIMAGYPSPINGIKALNGFFNGETFPRARDWAKELVTLPVHPFVSERDNRYISECISGVTCEAAQ